MRLFLVLIGFFILKVDTSFAEMKELVPTEVKDGWKLIQTPFSYQNLQVPREFWEVVREVLHKDGVKESAFESFSVMPIPTHVHLASQDSSVLKDSLNYRISFVEGGGNLDLFKYITGKGAFHLKLAPDFPEDAPSYLIYISDSPGKTVEGDKWGNGCGKIYDLTQQSKSFLEGDGMRLTSSRRHYMHLMAGTFIFFQLIDERMFLGYIRLKDSRFPNFRCSKEV